ncbi:MAG TPA: peptide chain release factor 2, partial [Clostridiaceae bacterium]|nr:peptide chain release factor 2 [Clostridiaceae bacterium]
MKIELEEYYAAIKPLEATLDEIRSSLDLDKLKNEVEEIEGRMQQKGFWDDIESSKKVSQKLKNIKSKISKYEEIHSKLEDYKVLIELADTEDELNPSALSEVEAEKEALEKEMADFKIKTLLSGEYDFNNAIITLHAGAGGTEACDWVDMLLRMYTRWAERHGFSTSTLDLLPGDEAGVKSVTLQINGDYAYGCLKSEKGVHRLVRISPFDAAGKRHTSFASMEVLPEITPEQDIDIRPEDLKVDTYRAGGAGGQYVNKTESAVRITHLPTGIVVQCQTERSQHSNRETALKMLKSKLIELKEAAHKEKIEDLAGIHKEIGWGSQIRSYVFQPYTLV